MRLPLLPGGGSDGAVGVKAVKEAGGLVLVQGLRETAHEGMPRAVIAAEVADLVLPVRELAQRLGELLRHKKEPAMFLPRHSHAAKMGGDELVPKRIFELVRARSNHAFSRYKRATILRRLARRMQLGPAVLEHYLRQLKERPEAVQAALIGAARAKPALTGT